MPTRWSEANARGLTLAAAGDWPEAVTAFEAARTAIREHGGPELRDAEALVASNLAQACLQAGRVTDAILHAQHACAVRAALYGEDAMVVARARADLAVILGTAGRTDEAFALLTRVIATLDHAELDAAVPLPMVLENAARLALASGRSADAVPVVQRLRAVLTARGLSTAPADQLLHELTRQTVALSSPDSLVDASARGEPLPPPPQFVPMHDLDIEEAAGADRLDDLPLRDTLRVTETLMRLTPSSVPIVPAEPEPIP